MDIPSFKKDHINQVPALQMMVNLGCLYIINQNLQNTPDDFIKQKLLYRYGI
jgi:hypothetical protein